MDRRFMTILVSVLLCFQVEAFCGSRSLQTSLTRSAVRAAEWLRNQQDVNGTYGEGHVSAFVFHSLRLVGHSVENGADHLNAEIIKKGLGSITGGRVALYIHGALATCRDPQKFFDFNLLLSLQTKLDDYPQLGFNHPFQYALAVLALCSSGGRVEEKKLNESVSALKAEIESLSIGHGFVDTLAIQVLALSCILKSNNSRGKHQIQNDAQAAIDTASAELLRRQQNDRSFGENEVSAALAAQVGALVASREDKWNCSETMEWLKSQQNADGSFINFLATIYVLPSLIGALPFEVRNITCPSDSTGEQKNITVCVELQFDANNFTSGKTPPPTQCVTVLNGTNAHDILKLAANQHPCFNFTTLKTGYGHMITSICGIDRRPVEKFYWMIYIGGKSAPVGVDDLKPGNGDTLLFEYKKLYWKK